MKISATQLKTLQAAATPGGLAVSGHTKVTEWLWQHSLIQQVDGVWRATVGAYDHVFKTPAPDYAPNVYAGKVVNGQIVPRDSDKRASRLLVPVTDLEHEAVTVFASRLGLSAADVVRQALAAYVPDFPMADDQRGDHWANKRLLKEYGRWLAENDDPMADESFEEFLKSK